MNDDEVIHSLIITLEDDDEEEDDDDEDDGQSASGAARPCSSPSGGARQGKGKARRHALQSAAPPGRIPGSQGRIIIANTPCLCVGYEGPSIAELRNALVSSVVCAKPCTNHHHKIR